MELLVLDFIYLKTLFKFRFCSPSTRLGFGAPWLDLGDDSKSIAELGVLANLVFHPNFLDSRVLSFSSPRIGAFKNKSNSKKSKRKIFLEHVALVSFQLLSSIRFVVFLASIIAASTYSAKSVRIWTI